MFYDTNFLYEFLITAEGHIWRDSIDFLICNWYCDINDGKIDEKIMPKDYKFFLENYYFKEKIETIANDICTKIDSKKIPYYFKNFSFPQLSVIFFAISYGLRKEQLQLFSRKELTASNMSSILYCLISIGNDPNIIKQMSENFKGRFSQTRFERFVREHQISSKIPNV